jgi:hypothetical protein
MVVSTCKCSTQETETVLLKVQFGLRVETQSQLIIIII